MNRRMTKRERKARYGKGPAGTPNPNGNRHHRRTIAKGLKYNNYGNPLGLGKTYLNKNKETIYRIASGCFGKAV